MSVDTFKPEIWSAVLLESLKKSLVYGSLVNTDYEGDIAQAGDTVHINSVGRPTIGTYVPGVTTVTPEQVQTAQNTLIVDQSKYFAVEIDDVDRRQAQGSLLLETVQEAAYGLADVNDQFIAGLYTGVNSANNLGTVSVTTTTVTDAYDKVLIPLKVTLDDANVPMQGRWVVIPPWFQGRLLGDNRFINANQTGADTGAMITGYIGTALGMDIYVSNNTPFPGGDDNIVIAGNNRAISYARQIAQTEAYRPQSAFADAIKGLSLYGAKLLRPDSLAVCQASQT